MQLNYSRHVEALNPGFEFGWDTHIYNFELLQDQLCPILDRAFAALIDDLYERGLIDDTLIVMMGEFGRTPKISFRAAPRPLASLLLFDLGRRRRSARPRDWREDNRGEHPRTSRSRR